MRVATFAWRRRFLQYLPPNAVACLVLGRAGLPGLSGLDLQRVLANRRRAGPDRLHHRSCANIPMSSAAT
jgi:FixJ family two-component response regulator